MEDTPASLDETVPVFSVPPATDSLPAADQTVGGRIKADSATFSNSKSPNSTPGGEGGSAVGKFSADRFAARGKDLLTLEAPREASTPVIRMAPTAAAPSPESSAGMTQSLRTADGKGLNDEQRIHWQSALSSSVQSPLWGNDSGADQTREALMAASKAGQLNILRDHLEEQCAQSPQDIGAGRMLAALYDFSGKSDLGLQERRRLSGLAATTGEDWFALAQAEERAGNIQAAKAAYRHALESPVPPNASHAARARQRE